MKLKLNEIKIGERQRVDLGDLQDLDSMSDKDVGQIEPIVVHRVLDGWELVDGRRRLAKATELGWPEIDAWEKATLTEVQKNKMELFADIGRKDRTWQETCLSVYKIHRMLQREKASNGEQWTVRNMAAFTGFSKSSIGYFLQVANALQASPRDEEIWTADGYTSAFKILLQRQVDETRKEQELRRARLQQAEQRPLIVEEEQLVTDEFSDGLVQTLDSTPKTSSDFIKLHGKNLPFAAAVQGEHYGDGLAHAVLALRPNPMATEKVRGLLRPTGFAVLWHDKPFASDMPFHLIWNSLAIEPSSDWPFCNGYMFGSVLGKPAKFENPATPVNAAPSSRDGELPAAIVDWVLSAICPANVAVYCLEGVNPVHVAETGRVPIWFEPDKARYDEKVAVLKKHYAELGIEVRE